MTEDTCNGYGFAWTCQGCNERNYTTLVEDNVHNNEVYQTAFCKKCDSPHTLRAAGEWSYNLYKSSVEMETPDSNYKPLEIKFSDIGKVIDGIIETINKKAEEVR